MQRKEVRNHNSQNNTHTQTHTEFGGKHTNGVRIVVLFVVFNATVQSQLTTIDGPEHTAHNIHGIPMFFHCIPSHACACLLALVRVVVHVLHVVCVRECVRVFMHECVSI